MFNFFKKKPVTETTTTETTTEEVKTTTEEETTKQIVSIRIVLKDGNTFDFQTGSNSGIKGMVECLEWFLHLKSEGYAFIFNKGTIGLRRENISYIKIERVD